MLRNTKLKYGSVSKSLHWLVFLLVLTLVLIGFFWPLAGAAKGDLINVHKLLGLLTLMIVIVRMAWTLNNQKPDVPNANRVDKVAEHTVHGLIYLALLAMPLSGWLMVTAAGRPPHLLGHTFEMPGISENMSLAAAAARAHSVLAWVLITLVAIHILAALKHHFVNKDNVLKRMLPGDWN